MAITLENIGKKTYLSHEYNWRRHALYSLSVGAGVKDELDYVYEKNQKINPCYWAAILGLDDFLKSYEYGQDDTYVLHYGFEIMFEKPITEPEGKINYTVCVKNVYDRGDGKGAVAYIEAEAFDESGEKRYTLITKDIDTSAGGFGGEPLPKASIVYPDREPDYVIDDYIGPNQAALYRIDNDTSLFHIDPEEAKKNGFDKPIIMGMCTAGYAFRALIKALVPGKPENIKKVGIRFSRTLLPDRPIQTQIWKIDDHHAVFKLINKDNGDTVLNFCEVEF